ncbi:Alpha/beta hydrolase fold-1 domain-containing protein [Penicillium ucsense]|uniref:Alpha/beta hydrolase fold-1 domain-containing protein n=1 Tax=Penicillium ucsense TaxID=2839758 RepID=A0A8J8W4U6_9EURO|nr:Alpha/beta hydrolase fold-1 domain-containing protein [Penicillium ucsense]KAF7738381.1 Alpha/beta hydrolase fold-1 domain-containing protein [Penicillium ucsense]
MPSSPFRIVEHRVPCQHIREYPGATADEQEEPLHLAVKQYIPIDNPNPQPGDVTILGAHANGFPKELYEPLWEEIHARSKASGLRIRSIWMADVAHQGESSVINENSLGNDPSWFDHPRDLLHLINVKRAEMPRPIVGIGHSMGGAHLAQLSLMHPRLLHTLVLLDPVIQRQTTQLDAEGMAEQVRRIAKTTQLSTYRRDMWPSRKAAAEGFKRSPFYQAWDPRVLDRWIKYGLRDLPTAVHPLDPNAVVDKQNPPVTLRTTLHQEVFTFSRPNYANRPGSGKPVNRVTHPDLDAEHPDTYPFYRPEPARIFSQLPYLRPSVLYVFGGKSDMCPPEMMADKLANTGTAIGGSGGVAKGRVRDVLLEDYGHLLAQEAVNECAEAAVSWLTPELRRWRDEEESFRSAWSRKSKVEKLTVDKQWYEHVPAPARRPNNGEKKSGESKL